MTAMLEPIVAEARRRATVVGAREEEWRATAAGSPPARDFVGALRQPGLSVIAEVKRRSPSAGPIAPDLDPGLMASEYAAGGAAALSVLTEPSFFGGSLQDLGAAREATGLPVLRKDFVLDPVQVWESRAVGADAVLLIVAILDDGVLQASLAAAAEAGLAALVEVHLADEARRAVDAGAGLIGVNNRDLSTFRVDPARAESIRPLLPPHVVTVAESGISGPAAARRMAAAGFDAVLVGEAAVRAPDRSAFVRSIGSGR